MIVTWNGREDTLRALEQVQAQATSERGAAIVVVDNGSTDGTTDEIGRTFPGVELVRLSENRGFTGGVAAGVRRSSADQIILLNNDAVPEAGWLGEMRRSLESAPADVVAIGGKITDSHGKLTDFIGGILTFDGHAFQKDFRRPLETVEPPVDGSEMLFACGGNMIVRRREFVSLGGFDDDYFAYLEDVDFGWRTWLSGFRILYNDRAVVRHRSSATSQRLGNYERGVLFERNALQTALKNYGDEMLKDFAGPMFLILLHRLHHYTTSRNASTEGLTRPPFGEHGSGRTSSAAGGGMLSRLRRKLGRLISARPEAVVIDDPLTMMQFRAMEWFFQNSERIMRKREGVQRMRKRTDREIFDRFPIHYVPTYEGDGDLMASTLFRLLRPIAQTAEARLEDVMRL